MSQQYLKASKTSKIILRAQLSILEPYMEEPKSRNQVYVENKKKI